MCISTEVYQSYEGKDYDKIYEVSPTLKNEKLKINKILIEKNKDMFKIPDFELDCYSRTNEGIYKIVHGSIRVMIALAHYDRVYCENIIYYDLMESICTII